MTTIKSQLGGARLDVQPTPTSSEHTYLFMYGVDGSAEQAVSASFPTAELLAALNAVDANKVLQDASDALDARRELEVKLAAVTAERDAHAATIERVREAMARWNLSLPNYGWAKLSVDAALEPEPAFVLPTEAGAGIRAKFAVGKWKDEEAELRLFGDGRWRSEFATAHNPDGVLRDFYDHRLLDGVE